MKKFIDFVENNINNLGKIIIIISIFSSFFLSCLYRLANYSSIFNYSIFVLLIVYLIIYYGKNYKNINFKDPQFKLIILFLLFNFVSILLNGGKVHNLKIFIMSILQWVLIFYFVKRDARFFKKILNALNYFIFSSSFASVILFVLNIVITNYLTRYCGIYTNPNTGSLISVVSIGISLFLFADATRKKRIFLCFNFLIQFAIIQLCMSRTSEVSLLVFLFISVLVSSILLHKRFTLIVRNFVFLIVMFGVLTYTVLPGLNMIKSLELGNGIKIEVNKRDDSETSSSNMHRLLLLKCGTKSVLEKPLLGHGIADFPASVSAYSDIKLEGIEGGGVHNGYLQMIITNGVLGFICFAGVHILLLVGLFKRRKKILSLNDPKRIIQFSALLALYFTLLTCNLFESLFLTSTLLTNMFAMVSGGLRNEE